MKLIKKTGIFLKDNYLVTILLFLLIFIFFYMRLFYTLFNFRSLLIIFSIYGFLVIAEGLVVITGGIDLSVGNIASFSCVMCAFLSLILPGDMNPILKVIVIIISIIIGGAIMGAISGFSVVVLKIPPLIATLVTMWIAKAAAFYPLKGEPKPIEISEFNILGSKTFFKLLPVSFFILIGVAILIYFILSKTRAGRYIYYIGGNEYSSYLSGINVKNIKFLVYLFSGSIAAIAGIFLSAWTKTGFPRAAEGYEFIAITAVVLGGFSLSGGIGNIWNALLGVFILAIINKFFAFSNVTAFAEGIFIGAILLISLISVTFTKKEEWR